MHLEQATPGVGLCRGRGWRAANITVSRELAQARVRGSLALSPQGVPSCYKTLAQSLPFSGFEFLLDSWGGFINTELRADGLKNNASMDIHGQCGLGYRAE